jgi:D-3-phosphoglycerate dehydrogenase
VPVSHEDLLGRADIASVHAPLNEATRHLIDARALARMKRGSCLVNTSRGGLVDEAALLDALNRGHIRAAALDVLQHEPPPRDHPLVKHPNVVVTAHSAFYSEQAQAELHTRAAQAVLDVLQGRTPRNAV